MYGEHQVDYGILHQVLHDFRHYACSLHDDLDIYVAKKPIVVGVFHAPGGVPILQHCEVLNGDTSVRNIDLITRKAWVVASSGLAIPDAHDKAKVLGVSIRDWIPEGTELFGAAPVKIEGELIYVVAVSGQDHKLWDQPAAQWMANELERIIKKAEHIG